MYRTLYRRDSRLMRLLSAFVALSFTLSLAGPGYASTPTVDPAVDQPVAAAPAVEPVPEAPAEVAPKDAEPAPDPSVEAQPTTGEAKPAQVEGTAGFTAKSTTTGTRTLSTLTPSAIQPMAGSGDISIVEFNGYNRGQGKWTSGNLGKEYVEGENVWYRLVLKNTGTAPVDVTDVIIGIDHFDANPNAAVMFDKTQSWSYKVTSAQPAVATAEGAPGGVTAVTPAYKDVPTNDNGSAASFGSADTINTKISAGAFSIPAGQYGTVYFQGHLALTVYWQLVQPGTDGASGYPGSSGHGYLRMDAGARTLPLPSVEAPGGSVVVKKFYDTNHDGIHQADETQMLSGWTIHLTGSNGFSIDIPKVTDANGEATFGPLPDGTFTITEEMQPGWASQFTSAPAVVTAGGTTTVWVGNYHPDVVKTWSLAIDNLPASATPYVKYRVDGGALQTTELTGSGPYTAQMTVPYGAVISDISWWVDLDGEDIQLGTSADETLTGDKTNSFTYDSSVSGTKYDAATEEGIEDWDIFLYRMVDGQEVLYGVATTDANGDYSFTDVLPGDYVVHEELPSGWLQMSAPAAGFTIANGTHVTDQDFSNLFLNSSIDIDKTGPALAHVGDEVTYTVVVTNTGNYTLTNVLVTDPLTGLNETLPTLAPGESMTFYPTYTIQADDTDPLPNTAVAIGVDGLGNQVSDSDDHLVDILKPQIDVVKTASPEIGTNPVNVTYTYVVTNTGEDTLYNVTLVDDKLTVPGGATIGTLAAGESVTLYATTELTVSTTNVASVEGYDALELKVEDTDDAHVDVYNPAIDIVKSADPLVGLPGDEFTYTYVVTNTGDIALHDIDVTDNILGVVGFIPMLAPGASQTLFLSSNVMDDTTNIGSAVGWYGEAETEFYGSVSDTSEAYVEIVNPSISVEKTADPTQIVAGGSVDYDYAVTNTGDVTLYNVSVVDDKLGSIGVIAVLLPQQTVHLSASAMLDETTVNVVTVTGTDEYGHEVSDDDDAEVLVYNPAISIDKTVDETTVLAGATVTYTYVVTNTGDIDLHDVAVTDDKLGAIGTITALAVGESQTLTKDAAIGQDTVNVATAEGYYGEAETDFYGSVMDSDDAAVNVIAPAVSIDKTVEPSAVITGGEVTYTYVVTNTGDVDLFDLVITDDKLGEVGTLVSLAVGASETFTMTTTLDESTTNVATVVGYDELQNEVTDSDDAFVPVYNPAISIDKTVDPTTVLAGETVTYTYVVTNTGDIDLHDVEVTDDKLGTIGTIDLLAVGESETLTMDAAIAEDTVNVGTAVGYYGEVESDFYGSVSDTDDASVDVVAPAIDVVKTVDKPFILSGESVLYTYVVTNTGDVDLFNVMLNDDKLGAIGETIAQLAVGESQTFTKSTQVFVPTTNVVVATGVDRVGHEVSDEDTAVVDVAAPFMDWAFDKSADKVTAKRGDIVTYSLTYKITEGNDRYTAPISIVDDYDERYVTPVDLNGGEVKDGKIYWTDANEQGMAVGDSRTITYTMKVRSDVPVGTTKIDNLALLNVTDPPLEDTWRVTVTVDEPFLPFTGSELSLLVLMAALAVAVGILLRTFGRASAR